MLPDQDRLGRKSLYKDFTPSAGRNRGYYQKTLAEVEEALKNYHKEFPPEGQEARVGGFVWFRGGTICLIRMPLPSTNKTSFI